MSYKSVIVHIRDKKYRYNTTWAISLAVSDQYIKYYRLLNSYYYALSNDAVYKMYQCYTKCNSAFQKLLSAGLGCID